MKVQFDLSRSRDLYFDMALEEKKEREQTGEEEPWDTEVWLVALGGEWGPGGSGAAVVEMRTR